MSPNIHLPSLGASTAECLRFLASANPDIQCFGLVTIKRPDPLQERVELSDSEEKSVRRALSLRAQTHLPFWDSLLLAAFNQERFSERLLEQAKFHQSNIKKEHWIDANLVRDGELERLSHKHLGPTMLSVLSEVRMKNGNTRHFVFLDFHIPVSPANTLIVKQVAEQLLTYPALIIESGASYHLIGTKLVNPDEFRTTLTTALFFGPITDRAYIAHQLLERRAALRYSKGGHCDMVPRLLLTS